MVYDLREVVDKDLRLHLNRGDSVVLANGEVVMFIQSCGHKTNLRVNKQTKSNIQCNE